MIKTPSAEHTARQERMRTAAKEGAVALADVRAKDIAVRKNMERLRALRLAQEAAAPLPEPKPKRVAKKKVVA